ncbi:family 10 glycosylhydrolase [bacterium]|nr:family 10 glycosylhydrolase [bacterium]
MSRLIRGARGPLLGALMVALLGGGAFAQGPNPFDDPFAAPDPGAQSATPTPTPAEPSSDPFSSPDSAAESGAPFISNNPFDSPAATPAAQPTNPFEASGSNRPAVLSDIPLVQLRPVPLESGEIRGIYVLAADRGYQNSVQLEELVSDINTGGFSRVYAEVRTVLGVAYVSGLEESLPSIGTAFPNPLGTLRNRLEQKKRLIAVVNVLPAYAAATGGRPPLRNPIGRFPEYANRSLDDREIAPDNVIYMDPGDPDVVRYLSAIVREIDTQIAPDGYLFTGVRYPGADWGYSPGAVKAFRAAVGGEGAPPADDPVWSAWRRDRLTQLIRSLRNTIISARPDVTVGVLIETSGPPPNTFEEYIASSTYKDSMVDWISWAREGLVSELVFQVHERVSPDDSIRAWAGFAGNNQYNTSAIISLAGYMNFSEQFRRQVEAVRSRGLGTVIYHYASPIRDRPRGFYQSLPNVFYRSRPGRIVETRPIDGPWESRIFTRMFSPPAQVLRNTPTPTPATDVLGSKPLEFATPSPIPSPTPVPSYIPSSDPRRIVLSSGSEFDAIVLEVTPVRMTVQRVTLKAGKVVERLAPVTIERRTVASIEPPL